MITLVEARPWHCGAMSRCLRLDHRALLASMNVPIHHDMREAFDASLWCRKTLFIDGKIAAVGGVTGSPVSSEAAIWLAVSEDAAMHPVKIARLFRRELDLVMETHRRLVTIVFKDDRKGMLLAYFLGFRVKEPKTVNGAAAAVMEIVRN